ncbi:T9SS type B sorting domain-containing protein [Flavobacterium sediminilitoris]|uniref:T9SS type B sorting domain-containing protein n=1 Tax=Flavobacterium sediminilitoris TaxID=2024526 RepID=A0ABY4HNE3_9FLAO|nr:MULTISPECIES: T9SS type B sorting domain-containing protein [Flavobacterium]UOX33857.1 T9SS type B sorting domain-containing protein [Flavobacterium sediminilitoris]
MRFFCVLLFLVSASIVFAQKQTTSIGFIENKGQIIDQKGKENRNVKYLLNTTGLNVQLRENGFSYDVYETERIPLTKKDREFNGSNPSFDTGVKNPDYSLKYNFHRIDIDFLNSNKNVTLVSEEKSSDHDNYYNVTHAPNGITNVHKYQKVTYQNIYSNIDVVFFIPKDSTKVVEYNFIVKPGGKVSDIQLQFNGGKTELVDNKIKMNLRFGQMEETLPLSWVENGPSREEISINYKKIKKNVYGFEGEVNSSNKTIVIDPVPVRLWGTYYGGGNQAFKTNTTKTDNLNNVIFTGLTYSSNNVGTAGSFQNTGIPLWATAFIAKMNPNGVRIWGTYVKNNTFEAIIYDLAVNSSNEVYAVGYTWDQDGLANTITTPGSFREFGSAFSREGILIKFNENGQRIWGTFYGGEGFDEIRTIHLDSSENLIIAGQTKSSTGISTNDGYLLNNPNSSFYGLGFFSKFNSNGQRLYGSYFQGEITFCSIDINDDIYFAGQYSESTNYLNITTLNAHQNQCFMTDVFVVKFDANFSRDWCTYYGGNGNLDKVTGLDTDNLNNVYLIGTTSSTNNIATAGSFKENLALGGVDAFLVKFNALGVRQWGTYFGGNNPTSDETAESGSVSDEGNIYIAGNTRSYYEIISTPNSYQTVPDGSDDCFFAKFNTDGNLIWCSYYGTPSQDYSSNIYFKNNIIYLLGYSTGIATNGNDLGTPGTHMPTGSGFFLGKFQDCLSSPQISAVNPCIGSNLELTASGGTNYSWTGPNGFTSTDQNPIIPNATVANNGQYSCTVTGTGGCDDTVTIDVVVGDNEAPIPTITNLPTITGDCNTIITSIPTATDNCAGTINATTTDPLTYATAGNYTITWLYDDGNGNTSNQTQNVTITAVTLPIVTSPQQFCIQDNATINDILITGQNITWYNSQTGGTILSTATSLQNGVTYYASQTINGCESDRVPVSVTIQNTPAPTGNANQSFCSTANATLNEIVSNGSNVIWYDSLNGNLILPNTTPLVDGTTYYATQTINGCESVSRSAITISLINTLNATDYSESFCDNLDDGYEIINLTNYNANLISSTGNTFNYYTSLNGAENQIISDKITNPTNYNLTIGNHIIYVRIDSPNTCHQVVTLDFTLYSKPFLTINDIMPICEGSYITIFAGNGYDNYLWSTNETSPSITVFQPGNYSVTVSENHNNITCTTTKNFTVVNSNIATISQIITSDWNDNNNTITVLLTSNSEGDYDYSLDGINFQSSNTFNGLDNGEYTVYVRDKNGCGEVSGEVYLLMYPKFFTPNGDGYNDFWKIKFSENEPSLTIKIFDRYGKFIKQLGTNSQGWDGNYLEKPLPSSDYWFIVTRENGKEFKGHFTLKR